MSSNNNVGTTALDYFKGAEGHMNAAGILRPHTGLKECDFSTTNTVFLAFMNVLGFGLELYFKSYLAHVGHTSESLSRRPFGHDLQALFDQCIQDGLKLPDDTIKIIVINIGHSHGEYVYRYLREGARIGYICEGEPMDRAFYGIKVLDEVIRSLVVKN